MEISGSRSIAAPRDTVWAALNDPDVLRRSIPGCQRLEPAGENAFDAVVEVKIGPIGASFTSTVRLEDIDAPASYRIVGEGKGGMAGHASGSALVNLTEEAGGTLLVYRVSAEVGGRLAQLGGAVIDATAKRLSDQFFARFEQIVTGDQEAAPDHSATERAMPQAGVTPAAKAGFPWGWAVAVIAAALAAFLAGGGAFTASGDGGILAAVLLAVFATAFGFETGRRR